MPDSSTTVTSPNQNGTPPSPSQPPQTPLQPGQVHPTARSLNSHDAHVYNEMPDSNTTVMSPNQNGTKNPTHPASPRKNPAPPTPREKPRCTPPGSPHSKKLELTPGAALQPNAGLRLHSNVPVPKRHWHLCPASTCQRGGIRQSPTASRKKISRAAGTFSRPTPLPLVMRRIIGSFRPVHRRANAKLRG